MKIKAEAYRIAEAYISMARNANYRPAAPGDGCGGVDLTKEELADGSILASEAVKYAKSFIEEESGLQFFIGVSNYETNRSLVFVVESARLLCAGENMIARKLLSLALEDIPR